jgi:hypothetical protein
LILPVVRPCQATVGHPDVRKENTGVPNGDQASCPVVRTRAGGGDACGLRPAHGHRAIGAAGRRPAGVPGAAAPGIGRAPSARGRSVEEAYPVRRQAGRRQTGGHGGWLGRDRELLQACSKTANGEQFNPNDLTAAHRTLPFGTRLRVTHVATGQSVTVRVNDRGPFIPGRVVDVSHSAAEALGMIDRGITKVKLEVEK